MQRNDLARAMLCDHCCVPTPTKREEGHAELLMSRFGSILSSAAPVEIPKPGTAMTTRTATARRSSDLQPLRRGVKCEVFPDRLEYYSVSSRGERSPRVTCGLDMRGVHDVIADLWDALNRDDPQRPAVVAPPRLRSAVLHLVGRD